MLLSEFMESIADKVKKNRTAIIEHAYFLQCMDELKSESISRDFDARLAWDFWKSNYMRDLRDEIIGSDIADEYIESLVKENLRRINIKDVAVSLSVEKRGKIMDRAKRTYEEEKRHVEIGRLEKLNVLDEAEKLKSKGLDQTIDVFLSGRDFVSVEEVLSIARAKGYRIPPKTVVALRRHVTFVKIDPSGSVVCRKFCPTSTITSKTKDHIIRLIGFLKAS